MKFHVLNCVGCPGDTNSCDVCSVAINRNRTGRKVRGFTARHLTRHYWNPSMEDDRYWGYQDNIPENFRESDGNQGNY